MKTKKLITLGLALVIFLNSFPVQAVLAQSAAEVSPTPTIEPTPTPFESSQTTSANEPNPTGVSSDPLLNLDTTSLLENLSEKEITVDSLVNSVANDSAQFRRYTVIKQLRKKNYRADEKVTVIVENAKTEDVEIKVFGSDGGQVSITKKEISDTSPLVLRIYPKDRFKPGRYRVMVTDKNTNTKSFQDFTWGVLAINTNKSIYLPNEVAKLSMAVLDEMGSMVCNASVILNIKDPTGNTTSLSTENGAIKVNPQCSLKDFTLIPDYETDYKVGGVGLYELSLFANTQNGNYSITDSFEVRAEVPFDVERIGPTRIYPPKDYPVEFNIYASEDFEGTISETVPDSFEVYQLEGAIAFGKVTEFLASSVEDIKDPQISNIGLPFLGEHSVTQDFGGIERDPLLKQKYSQYGVIGHDGVDFDLSSGTPVLAADDGEVVRARENSDYGTTIVIQHIWGKSYYGHLSTMNKKEGESVKKGEQIALSGNTGLATGPHLHFSIKPNKNDFDNGFYGKINPLAYLKDSVGIGSLAKGQSSLDVLGAKTEVLESDRTVPVKMLTWNVKLKKGESIKIGYNFNAPDISPKFYTLGPLEFKDNLEKIIFRESRQWQIAADAITYQTPGALAYSAAGGTTVAPAYPASTAAGDLLVLIIGMKPSTANSGSVTTPDGWSSIISITGAGGYGNALAADTGNTNLFTYYKVADGTESGSLTVTIATNNISWAQIYRFSTNATKSWSVVGATGEDVTQGTAVSINMTSNPGVTAGDYIIGAMVIPTDVTTPSQFSAEALSQTGITFGTVTEISEPDSATGNQIGGFTYQSSVSSGTSSGAPTLTATAGGTVTNVRGPGVFIRIREGAATLYPDDGGSNQIAFSNTRQNDTTPIVRASAIHTSTFDRFQVEFNTASDFSGTAYTETFSNTYSSATPYNLQTTASLNLPSTDGVTYYVRARASADGGTNYGSWSSETWTYTYTSTAGDARWVQTTDKQFDTGTLASTKTSGSDRVFLGPIEATGGTTSESGG